MLLTFFTPSSTSSPPSSSDALAPVSVQVFGQSRHRRSGGRRPGILTEGFTTDRDHVGICLVENAIDLLEVERVRDELRPSGDILGLRGSVTTPIRVRRCGGCICRSRRLLCRLTLKIIILPANRGSSRLMNDRRELDAVRMKTRWLSIAKGKTRSKGGAKIKSRDTVKFRKVGAKRQPIEGPH